MIILRSVQPAEKWTLKAHLRGLTPDVFTPVEAWGTYLIGDNNLSDDVEIVIADDIREFAPVGVIRTVPKSPIIALRLWFWGVGGRGWASPPPGFPGRSDEDNRCGSCLLASCPLCPGSGDQHPLSRGVSPLPPALAELPNWREIAEAYPAFVLDLDAQGPHLPLAWWDQRGINFGLDQLALAAYVGDHRFGRDGAQEAISGIAPVRSATLVGLDMSHWQGLDLVTMQKESFSDKSRQNLVLNNPAAVTGRSSWYGIYPSILFFILADQHSHLANSSQGQDDLSFGEIMRVVAERWEAALRVPVNGAGIPDFLAGVRFRSHGAGLSVMERAGRGSGRSCCTWPT